MVGLTTRISVTSPYRPIIVTHDPDDDVTNDVKYIAWLGAGVAAGWVKFRRVLALHLFSLGLHHFSETTAYCMLIDGIIPRKKY